MKYAYILLFCCFTLLAWGQQEGYSVMRLEKLNSNVHEFTPVPYMNGMVFTSDRSKGKLIACYDNETGKRYTDIFFVETRDNEGYENPTRLMGDANGKYHDGAPTFTADGNTMIFSRDDMEGKNENGEIKMKLYTAQKTENGWGNILPLPFNMEDYKSCHPTLSADGTKLYFSSDRPGGKGGMDLYMVERIDGVWGKAVNVEALNTSGNEIFPNVSENSTVYFSSNRPGGMGGLDIYSSSPTANGWSEIKTMEAPINSTADDINFIILEAGKKGYMSSNREGTAGKDDIYEWSYTPPPLEPIELLVVDARNENPLAQANISITPEYCDIPVMNDPAEASTSTDGKMTYEVYEACTYKVMVEREGYEPAEMTLTGAELVEKGVYQIPLTPKTSVFEGMVYNLKDEAGLPSATLTLVNKTTGERTPYTTGADGKFSFDINCIEEYELVATATDFKESKMDLTLAEINCEGTTTKNLGLEANPPKEIVVYLYNIFYDFDKSNIRPDAAERLDKLVATMQQYPSLKVQLDSYTDSRGSNTYNERLSARRTEAAYQYVIGKGISGDRISKANFGENQLTNQCKNGVKCTEEEHQRNRRTEVKVLEFTAPYVRIQVIN